MKIRNYYDENRNIYKQRVTIIEGLLSDCILCKEKIIYSGDVSAVYSIDNAGELIANNMLLFDDEHRVGCITNVSVLKNTSLYIDKTFSDTHPMLYVGGIPKNRDNDKLEKIQ